MNCVIAPGHRYMAYVEDDEDDRELFTEVAEAAQLSVRCFPDGRALLAQLATAPEAPPCLILLDMKNPVISGPETYALLCADERFRSIPVKFFSTSIDFVDTGDGPDASQVELIPKPDVYNDWVGLIARLADLCREPVPGDV
ncbi:MAG: response regulator [Chitinophagaceae bacterium]|nr:MAG: response regulator [Chitinophagaceae bacterium]